MGKIVDASGKPIESKLEEREIPEDLLKDIKEAEDKRNALFNEFLQTSLSILELVWHKLTMSERSRSSSIINKTSLGRLCKYSLSIFNYIIFYLRNYPKTAPNSGSDAISLAAQLGTFLSNIVSFPLALWKNLIPMITKTITNPTIPKIAAIIVYR